MAISLRLSAVFLLLLSSVVLSQDPDVSWTFGNVGSSSYRLDAFTPDNSNLGPIGGQNPTLVLELGKRYQVKITNASVHPFEVLAKGASAGQDKVLLSMGSPKGAFESDPDVAWNDSGSTVQFTLTRALYDAMWETGRRPGYRCRPHLFQMRGDFEIIGLPIAAQIRPFATPIDIDTVAVGLIAPVDLKPDPSDEDILYVVDQVGFIRVIDDGFLEPEPLLDVTDRLVQPLGFFGTQDENDYDERGLLGMALHPDFGMEGAAGQGKFYTYTSEPVDGPGDFGVGLARENLDHQSVVTEWQVINGQVDPNLVRELLRIDQPQFNHNGGMLAFGYDGYLYIALGDGGAANDDGAGHGDSGNGQNLETVHGSILRIDPLDPNLTSGSRNVISANGAYRIPWDNEFVGIDGIDEIYAYGLRNPYRFSFDRLSGMLVAADVGQGYVEEIDIIVKGGNYGWPLKEGSFLFDPEGVIVGESFDDPNLIDPVAEYDHDDGISVIGGFMYYGSAIPELRARYVFGEFSRGFGTPGGRLLVADLLSGRIEELSITDASDPLGYYIKGLGTDHQGEIYVLASTALGPFGSTGRVLKIVPFEPGGRR